MPLSQLFTKYDKNKDGYLEHSELLQALSDCHLKLGTNMRDVLMSQVFDPPARGDEKKGKMSEGSGKISLGVLKFYLEAGGASTGEVPMLSKSRDLDSGKGGVSDSMSGGLTPELLQQSKRAARKILAQCHSSIV